jgi:hypothetical protein
MNRLGRRKVRTLKQLNSFARYLKFIEKISGSIMRDGLKAEK